MFLQSGTVYNWFCHWTFDHNWQLFIYKRYSDDLMVLLSIFVKLATNDFDLIVYSYIISQ